MEKDKKGTLKMQDPLSYMGLVFLVMIVGGVIFYGGSHKEIPFVYAVWLPYLVFAPLAIHGFCWFINDCINAGDLRWYNKDRDIVSVCIAHYCGGIISNGCEFDVWTGAIFCIALFFVSKLIFWLIRSRKNKNSEKDG